jgi:hypothetical protein
MGFNCQHAVLAVFQGCNLLQQTVAWAPQPAGISQGPSRKTALQNGNLMKSGRNAGGRSSKHRNGIWCMFQGLVSDSGGPSGASGQAAKTIAVPSISLIASSPTSATIALVAIPARPVSAIHSINPPIIHQESAFLDIVLLETILVLALSLVLGGVIRHRPS